MLRVAFRPRRHALNVAAMVSISTFTRPPCFSSLEIGDLKGVRNHVDLEARASGDVIDGVNRQADPVDRDGALLRDELAEMRRHFHLQQPAFREVLPFRHDARRVNMASDEMAAKFVGKGQRFFKVDQRPTPSPVTTLRVCAVTSERNTPVPSRRWSDSSPNA